MLVWDAPRGIFNVYLNGTPFYREGAVIDPLEQWT